MRLERQEMKLEGTLESGPQVLYIFKRRGILGTVVVNLDCLYIFLI